MAAGARTVRLLEIVLIGFLIIFAAALSGCATEQIAGRPPTIDVKIWAGDFTKAAIVRTQDRALIQCSDPEFSDYMAISFEDLQKLIGSFQEGCERWKSE